MIVFFEPKEDITTFELAIIYSYIVTSSAPLYCTGVSVTTDIWNSMLNIKGANVQRHFRALD